MFGLGFSELLFLAILGLVLIGPKQLPEIARTIGRFLNELKRTTDGFKADLSDMASSEIRRSEQTQKKPEGEKQNSDSLAVSPKFQTTNSTVAQVDHTAQSAPAESQPAINNVAEDKENPGDKKS